MTEAEINNILSQGIHPAWRKADEKLLAPLLKKFVAEEKGRIRSKRADAMDDVMAGLRLAAFIGREIGQLSTQLVSLRLQHAVFTQHYARSANEEERRYHILAYAKAMGRGERALAQDRKAFERWFGMDAVADRYRRAHTRCERSISFCLGRLGAVSAHLIGQTDRPAAAVSLWDKLELELVLKPLLAHDGDSRVVIEAFRCLSTALQALPAALQEAAVNEGTLQSIYRSAQDSHQQVWVQCEALSLLQSLSPGSLHTALRKRLTEPGEGDDMFVRRRAVGLLGQNLIRLPAAAALVKAVLDDPSAFVRQALPAALHGAADAALLPALARLALQDPSAQVRAAALLALPELLARASLFPSLLDMMQSVLCNERDDFVLRVAVQVCVDGGAALAQVQPALAEQWQQAMQLALDRLRSGADSIAVRRWAGQAVERLWCQSNPDAGQLAEQLGTWLRTQKPGKHRTMPAHLLAGADPETLGRVLSVLAQDDFGFDVVPGRWRTRIRRGHQFGLRLWRLLHEFRNPSPDKRQAFRHTVGRFFSGRLRAPSGILAELAETKVPGEPLFISSEAGWRPYLPLLDDVISTLDMAGGKAQIYSSEGVTEIAAPRGVFAQLRAHCLLTTRFAQLASMRNWQETSQASPAGYIDALRDLGFEVHFRRHAQVAQDPSVSRFFSAGMAIPLGENWQRLEAYFFSVYENSLIDLAVFTLMALAYFIGKHLYTSRRIRHTRASLPLVLGGWGTRGKSGTERIKAAMLNALGYGLVSKTTGCEAMFLYADPYGKMHEMFLFRPYDKATIWEQFDVMRHAEGLGADIFMWECMALTPSYVRILQQNWVRDDISTITNTFPDHEDIQGPAGINIPEVMADFIPRDSVLISSEEHMLPILREAAERQHTRLEHVGWLEAGLLTPDVLQRFPYDEHPSNIALVLRLGEELGIAPDFALKEMADRVVPDLGVLKTYPQAQRRGRRLEFINGMSANERFGCLSNWVRMGLDRHNPEAEPGTWISTVVNNRADRVARSHVFAAILVNDIRADRHFLIGSNLSGLVGYIEEAWNRLASQLTLWPEHTEAGTSAPQALMQGFAARYRVASSQEAVLRRLHAMLQGLGHSASGDVCALWQQPQAMSDKLAAAGLQEHAADFVAAAQRLHQELEEYQSFIAKIADAKTAQRPALDQALRQLLHTWFKRRIVVVHDFNATGDGIIDIICRETPPGILNRVMGIQNIKGTGLDFVYRWQAWDTCFKACAKMRTAKPALIEQGVRELASFQEFGLLCEEHVRDTIRLALQSTATQSESLQAQLGMIASHLDLALEEVREKMSIVRQSGAMLKLLEGVEALLDAGDAVKRRKMADRIYRDLIDERISIERAVIELQGLNKRQKGGWLLGQLHQAKEYLHWRGQRPYRDI